MGRIRTRIFELGLSVYRFAEIVEIPESRFRRMIKGRVKDVGPEEVARISKGSGLDFDVVKAELNWASNRYLTQMAQAA